MLLSTKQERVTSLRMCHVLTQYPESTTHRPNVGLMLVHRLRRRPNIKTTLGRRIVFAVPS